MPRPGHPGMIEWLGAAENDLHGLGGKAASLDRLARLGFRIPPGFCLTTAAFASQYAAIPGAETALRALPDEAGRRALVLAFETTPFAADIRLAVHEAVARLVAELADVHPGPPLFAVRSSGTAEDGSASSYAGLHATELGVTPAGVEPAVRRCWASLWSGPALAYRLRRGLPLDGGGMAVIVQSLIPADAAVVVFTRHPVTQRDDQLVITAVRGLGESMVAGTVTPDTIVIDRASLAVLELTGGDRGRRLVATAGGGVADVEDALPGPALDGARLRELAALSLAVERAFGHPVDIEAAVADGRWYLLQARPITTI